MNAHNNTGRTVRNLLVAFAAVMFLAGCCCVPAKCAPGTKIGMLPNGIDPDGGGEPVERDGVPVPGLVKGGICVIDEDYEEEEV